MEPHSGWSPSGPTPAAGPVPDGVGTMGLLGTPALVVDGRLTCAEAHAVLDRDESLTSLVLRGADGRTGLVPRGDLAQLLAGRLGFGRVLHEHRPLAEVADWDPLVVPGDASVVETASLVVARERGRWRDVVVRTPTGLRLVGAGVVMQALAGAYRERATRDALTGLPNRSSFFDRLHAESAGGGGEWALVFIDLDGFKDINDEQGHHAGDAALRAVAAALAATARRDDLVARLGGDEFAVLLRTAPSDDEGDRGRETALVADRLRRAAEQAGMRASVGVALARPRRPTDDPTTAEDWVLREADLAMYAAKRAGGGRVVVADAVLGHLTLTACGSLERDPDHRRRDALVEAVAQDQLTLSYQPIVRLADRTVASLEALVRWDHPELGTLLPGRFLPDAERLGLSADLDLWVVEHAVADMARWHAERVPGLPRSVNVNVSRQLLGHPDLAQRVVELLRLYGVPPTTLRLELVEDTDPELLARAEPQLRALRAAGVRLTWDDMGSGSSSLKQVTQISADGLKIDRSFVARMLTSESARAVVRLLAQLGRALDLAVTAEGVETAEQLAAVEELGAVYAQGFGLSAPVPAHEVPVLLAAWTRREVCA